MHEEGQPEEATLSEQDGIADKAIEAIRSSELGVPPIPYYLVEKHHNKTTKLLSNSGENVSIQAKNRWHDYDFSSPLFIGFIDIAGTELSNSDEYIFKAKLEGGGKREFQAKPRDGALRVDINEFCNSISFKPPSVFWSIFARNPEIQKVSIYGFFKDDLGEFLYKIARTTRIKEQAISDITSILSDTNNAINSLSQKESQLEHIDSEISDANKTLETLNGTIAEKHAIDTEMQAKLDRAKGQLDSTNVTIDERKQELSTVTKNREIEKLEVEKAKIELKRLKEDINLFPSEISGFVNQAGIDIRTYSRFTLGMVVVIVVLFAWVLFGAFDLSEYVKENPNVSVWPLLLAKLPLAAVVSAIVAAAYKIARVFIEEMLKINRQKLSLTQVSIIAKDISQASESELDLSDAEIYGLRIRTKMAMLSDHIKTFIPTGPTQLFPQSIFSAFDRTRKASREEAEEEELEFEPEGGDVGEGEEHPAQ